MFKKGYKKNTPLFSIIVPTLNSGKNLEQCLNSIVSQTFQDYEVLIMDGISQDITLEVAKEYSLKFPNIRWVSKKDEGIYDAMNKGISLSKGEWIYFLGSDDSLYATTTLGEVQNKLKDYDVVYGNVTSPRFNGLYDGPFTKEKIYEKNICHQAIFFSRKVFKKVGRFNRKYSSHADWDHNLRWFLSAKIKKKYINLIFANYADGGFSSINAERFFSQIKLWKYSILNKKEIKFLNKLKIAQTEYKRAIREKRRRDALKILFQTPYFLL